MSRAQLASRGVNFEDFDSEISKYILFFSKNLARVEFNGLYFHVKIVFFNIDLVRVI